MIKFTNNKQQNDTVRSYERILCGGMLSDSDMKREGEAEVATIGASIKDISTLGGRGLATMRKNAHRGKERSICKRISISVSLFSLKSHFIIIFHR